MMGLLNLNGRYAILVFKIYQHIYFLCVSTIGHQLIHRVAFSVILNELLCGILVCSV